MPIYEYACEACGGQFELMQKFSDPPKKKCERCGGRLKKLMSSTAFQLKGSGWYATDYAKKAPPSPAQDKTEKKSEPSLSEVKKETAAKT